MSTNKEVLDRPTQVTAFHQKLSSWSLHNNVTVLHCYTVIRLCNVPLSRSDSDSDDLVLVSKLPCHSVTYLNFYNITMLRFFFTTVWQVSTVTLHCMVLVWQCNTMTVCQSDRVTLLHCVPVWQRASVPMFQCASVPVCQCCSAHLVHGQRCVPSPLSMAPLGSASLWWTLQMGVVIIRIGGMWAICRILEIRAMISILEIRFLIRILKHWVMIKILEMRCIRAGFIRFPICIAQDWSVISNNSIYFTIFYHRIDSSCFFWHVSYVIFDYLNKCVTIRTLWLTLVIKVTHIIDKINCKCSYLLWISPTLRSWLHETSALIMTLSPVLEKNYTSERSFNSFPGPTCMSGFLENCQKSVPKSWGSPIQGTLSDFLLNYGTDSSPCFYTF